LLGIDFVTRTGALASRWRTLFRNVVAWLPLLVSPLLVVGLLAPVGIDTAVALVMSLLLGLALTSLLLPSRGLADRIAGTWPVPR
jgi:hypothetical protein